MRCAAKNKMLIIIIIIDMEYGYRSIGGVRVSLISKCPPAPTPQRSSSSSSETERERIPI